MSTKTKINDLVIRFANVNGTGSASANNLFAKSIFKMGLPVSAKNIFPSNIQGLPTWYEVRISEKGSSLADSFSQSVANAQPSSLSFNDGVRKSYPDSTALVLPL